ncbi:hypothetical protein TKK_0003141 [Trichogramma kaykai]
MALENECNNYQRTLKIILRDKLNIIKNVDNRRQEFCYLLDSTGERNSTDRVIIELMNDEALFPSVADTNYFLKFGLKYYSLVTLRQLEENGLNIDEVIFEDGNSALHYLADLDKSWERNYDTRGGSMELMRVMVKHSRKNSSDKHGYSYLHGACAVGDVAAANRFISQGVDVDLDSYECSPLHIAAQYRNKEIVQVLLELGADPNKRDRDQSTPLHALAWLCLCECGTNHSCCDHRKPVDEIVDALIKKGANIEASDRHGDSPLNLAVSRFDVRLTRSLLKHGASLTSLKEDRIFGRNFELIELKNYPLTWNIIETIQLLQSFGYRLDLDTRFQMLKCWMRAQGNGAIHLNPYSTEWELGHMTYKEIINQIYIHERFGFFMKEEVADYLHEQREKLEPEMQRLLDPQNMAEMFISLCAQHEPGPEIEQWELQVAMLDDIKLNDNTSLYKVCQMNYHKSYSILAKINNWSELSVDLPDHGPVSLIVKRHIANIFIRLQLELFAADLFMSDSCKLNLPYTVCRIVAEKMSDEDLFTLCKKTDEENRVTSEKNCDVREENESTTSCHDSNRTDNSCHIDSCKANLPNTVCRKVAEKTSEEDLFSLCKKTEKENEVTLEKNCDTLTSSEAKDGRASPGEEPWNLLQNALGLWFV